MASWKQLRMRRIGWDIPQSEMAAALGVHASRLCMHERERYYHPNSEQLKTRYEQILESKIADMKRL